MPDPYMSSTGEEEQKPKKMIPNTDLTEEEVIEQIKSEYEEGLEFVKEKRQTFRDRLKLYNNQRKQKDKIGITLLYNTMVTLLAVYYTDELAVSFGGKGIAGTDMAENIELLAKSDNEDMNMDIINYMTQWDRLFFGVGIRAVHGFDFDNQVPIVESYDPFSWIPDPHGSLVPGSFRYMGFEVEMIDAEMTEDAGFYNTANLPCLGQPSDEMKQTQDAYREAQGLSMTDQIPGRGHKNYKGKVYPMINWYTVVDGRRYLITVPSDFSRVVRFEEIKPVYEKEKKNQLITPWGIALNYYSPERTNPFGTNVGDLVEDKQRAKSILANLQVSVVKAGLYPMYLYNRQKILNRRDLDFDFNKMIGVNGDPNNAAIPLNKDVARIGDTNNTSQMLDKEASLATGADANQSGVMSSTTKTASEVQQVQANANIRFALGSKINAWGDKEFWRLWYRCYVQFFPKVEAKIIEVTNAFGVQSLTLYGKQFLTEKSPKIIIRSKMESMAQAERERVAFSAIAPVILQDPTRPMVARHYTERHMLKLHGLTREQINIMIPPTPDEMTAHMENELLGRNEMVKLNINEDHLSHIAIHIAAPDSNAKKAHIQAHKQAYVQSGQQERDNRLREAAITNNRAAANSAQNSMMSTHAASVAQQKPSNAPAMVGMEG